MPTSFIRLGSKLTEICEYPLLSIVSLPLIVIMPYSLSFLLALAPTAPPAPSPPRTPHSNATLPAHPSLMRLPYQFKTSMTERTSVQQKAPLKFSRQQQRAASHQLGQMAAAGPMVAAISFARSSRWQDFLGTRDTDATFMRSRERQNMTRPSACRIWTSSYLVSYFTFYITSQLSSSPKSELIANVSAVKTTNFECGGNSTPCDLIDPANSCGSPAFLANITPADATQLSNATFTILPQRSSASLTTVGSVSAILVLVFTCLLLVS